MPLHVGRGCLPATITNLRINCIAQSATPPEMSLWEKIKEFFCSTHQTEAQECIWTICHPSVGTTREDVVSRFEQLRMLVYAGYEESIHSGRHGESHFCILDADNQEILSVTLDDAGNYTVNCQGHNETYRFTMDIEQGEECTEHAEGASGTLQVSPFRLRRLHRHQQSMMLSGQNGRSCASRRVTRSCCDGTENMYLPE